jgi:hypothetical protein
MFVKQIPDVALGLDGEVAEVTFLCIIFGVCRLVKVLSRLDLAFERLVEVEVTCRIGVRLSRRPCRGQRVGRIRGLLPLE